MTNLFFGGDGGWVVGESSWGNWVVRDSSNWNMGYWSIVGNSNMGYWSNWVVRNSNVGYWSNWVVGNSNVGNWVGNFGNWCRWDWSFGSSLGYLLFNGFHDGWVNTGARWLETVLVGGEGYFIYNYSEQKNMVNISSNGGLVLNIEWFYNRGTEI